MITRTISFADCESRVQRIVRVEAEDTKALARQTQRAMDTRLESEKYVFTSTHDTKAAPCVEDQPEPMSKGNRPPLIKPLAGFEGFQVVRPAALGDAITPDDKAADAFLEELKHVNQSEHATHGKRRAVPQIKAAHSGGAPLNSVAARVGRK